MSESRSSLRCPTRFVSREAYRGTRGVQRRSQRLPRFYSLSREAYNGTRPARVSSSRPCFSIRCREGRTAEPYPLRRGCDQHKRCPFSHPTFGGTFAGSPNTPPRRICAGQRLAHPRHLRPVQPPTPCAPGHSPPWTRADAGARTSRPQPGADGGKEWWRAAYRSSESRACARSAATAGGRLSAVR